MNDLLEADAAETACQAKIVEAFRRGEGIADASAEVRMLETHISWVFLVGEFAYKLKKAIRLNFLDFTGLDRRRHFCDEELRLNRSWAPELYLEVVPVTGTCERPVMGGDGDAIEYALKMRQFPQSARLDKQLELGELDAGDMRQLAEGIADRHAAARVIDFEGREHALGLVTQPVLDNYPHVEAIADNVELARVREWTEKRLEALETTLIGRHRKGFIRECHGDLHLANLVRLESGIVAFDCVEFASELRDIDVLSDISFLAMDLAARGRPDLAYVFTNRYLERTGDYAGMVLFDLYVVYHCMIRAKVAAIRARERGDAASRSQDVDEVMHYLRLAIRWIDRPKPILVAMQGLSGSGKTWLSSRLLHALPATRIRTDVERKRLIGAEEGAWTGSKAGEGLYAAEARAAVYDDVLNKARRLLAARQTVIVDAALLDRAMRERVREVAADAGSPFVIVEAFAPQEVLVERIRGRVASGDFVSEADLAVLDYQTAHSEALQEDERARTVRVDTSGDTDLGGIVAAIRENAAGQANQ
ncbi:MAG: AAA family ATPase [Woeseiaceae bacterium]|nr:AAA family ATPase [Woeseiaceae bacterium]